MGPYPGWELWCCFAWGGHWRSLQCWPNLPWLPLSGESELNLELKQVCFIPDCIVWCDLVNSLNWMANLSNIALRGKSKSWFWKYSDGNNVTQIDRVPYFSYFWLKHCNMVNVFLCSTKLIELPEAWFSISPIIAWVLAEYRHVQKSWKFFS